MNKIVTVDELVKAELVGRRTSPADHGARVIAVPGLGRKVHAAFRHTTVDRAPATGRD